ncbi:MAG TPA: hypothetical protein VJJ76_02055 [archaeon]|nr:hypothetical protein [archaeon]
MKKYSYHRSRLNHRFSKLIKELRKLEWKHHNIILLLVSIIIAYYILKFKPVLSFIYGLSYLGYFAAFIFGMLFTYALTAIPATAALYNLGQNFNPLLIAFIGAFGSVLSDYLIFRFVRDRLMDEIRLLSGEINNLTGPLSNLVSTKTMRIIIWEKSPTQEYGNCLYQQLPVLS